MSVEWLGMAKVAQATIGTVTSLYDRVVGKVPQIDFEVGDVGAALRIYNPREQTIIIEHIEAKPNMLGFSFGDSVRAIAEAVVTRDMPSDSARAVLASKESVSAAVITFDPFSGSPPDQVVTVRLSWRSSTRKMLHRGKVARKTSVRDIRDLQQAAENRQPRITIV
jgi:hypothetical protein